MIPPAKMHAAQWNVVDRMVQIGGPDAQSIERQADPCGFPQPRDVEPYSACNFRDAGDSDDVSWMGHPMWGDGDEAAGPQQMGDPGDQVEGGEQPARCCPYAITMASRPVIVRA